MDVQDNFDNEEYFSDSELSDDVEDDIFLGDNQVSLAKDGDVCDYECLGHEDLMQLISGIIDAVYQITKLPQTLIRHLLDHYKWDKDCLIDQYFEVNKTRLFRGAYIMPTLVNDDEDFPRLTLLSFNEIYKDSPNPPKGDILCEICYTPCHKRDLLALGCQHLFCRSCWIEHIKFKIMEDYQSNCLCCPAYRCENVVDDKSVYSLVSDLRVRCRFQKLIVNSFVLSSRCMTWCPGLDCGFAVRSLSGNQSGQIKCQNCNECFCFGCGNPWHEPVLCKHLRLWMTKTNADAATSHWVAVNTKKCPNCQATIEKYGGCDHMVCKNLNCKHEFCWLCLNSWYTPGAPEHACNRYNDKDAQKARDEKAQSESALKRFIYCVKGYDNHAQSNKSELKLHESVQRRMEKIQNTNTTWIDVQFVKPIVDVLRQCRCTLMYSYVFAYYLKENNYSLMFENIQIELEQATKELSRFLKVDFSTMAFADLKRKLQDKSQYCENRRRVLLEHVAEGYEKDVWEHVTP